jgi:hypothetical protein
MGKVGRFVVDASEASWSDLSQTAQIKKRVGEWLETLQSARPETLLPWNGRGSSGAVGF